jgi:hypothetical protein
MHCFADARNNGFISLPAQRAPGLPRALYVSRANEMQNFGQMMPREG